MQFNWKQGVAALALATVTSVVQAGISSDYTDLQNCRYVKKEYDSGAVIEHCRSLDSRYKVETANNGDWGLLDLFYQGRSVGGLAGFRDEFRYVGQKLEWRYTQNGSRKNYYALIYRMHSAYRNASSLIVVALNKHNSCIVGRVDGNMANANVRARQVADRILSQGIRCI